MALPRTASAAARADEAEQRHRLRHAFEFMAAALLGDEQTGHLGRRQVLGSAGDRRGSATLNGEARFLAS